MSRIIPWSLVTPSMVEQEGKLCGSLNSMSGPKLFYKVKEINETYIVTVDQKRDEIISVINQENGEAVYSHPLVKEGKQIMERMQKGLDMDFS